MLSTLSRRIFNVCSGTRKGARSLIRYRSGTSAGRLIQEDPLEHFYYSRFVAASGVPSSFVSDSLRDKEPEVPIDLVKARLQHANYVWQLKQLVDNVVYVPMDERYPDVVYVEDPVVVFDGTALITKIGHHTRLGESRNMKRVLKQLDFRIVELSDQDPNATMDGGDVLFTGKEFLVGLSARTNKVTIAKCIWLKFKNTRNRSQQIMSKRQVVTKIMHKVTNKFAKCILFWFYDFYFSYNNTTLL